MNKKNSSCVVIIPATVRVSIFEKTIDSFFEWMFKKYILDGNRLELILNVDDVGGEGSVDDLVDCIKGKFHHYLIHLSSTPNFAVAFQYLWRRVENQNYVFYLEDDWELLLPVDLQGLISLLEDEKDLAIMRLAAFRSARYDMKNWNKFFPYNERYYECPKDLRGSMGFCGHPSLIRGDFIRNIAGLLGDVHNPEKEFHSRSNTPIMQEIMKWRYGVYGVPGLPPIVRDLGRQWMVENNFRKRGTKAFFVEWEKI